MFTRKTCKNSLVFFATSVYLAIHIITAERIVMKLVRAEFY